MGCGGSKRDASPPTKTRKEIPPSLQEAPPSESSRPNAAQVETVGSRETVTNQSARPANFQPVIAQPAPAQTKTESVSHKTNPPALIDGHAPPKEEGKQVVPKPQEPVVPVRNLEQERQATLRSEKLADFTLTSHYTLLIWASDQSELARYQVPMLELDVDGRHITITPLTVTKTVNPTVPKVIDAVLYIITRKEDLQTARELQNKYKHVWLHMIESSALGTEVDVFVSEIGAQVVHREDDVSGKILAADKDLHILLKTIFQKIDSDGSGFIDCKELVLAAKEMNQEVTPQELGQALAEMDANKDSKVSFPEFRDWWKRGRQGTRNMHKAVSAWAERAANNVPGAVRELNGIMQKREKRYQGSSSTVQISLGDNFTPHIGISLDLGVGKAREALTVNIASKITYSSKASWMAVVLPCKVSPPDARLVKSMQVFWKSQFEMLLSTTVNAESLRNLIGVDVK